MPLATLRDLLMEETNLRRGYMSGRLSSRRSLPGSNELYDFSVPHLSRIFKYSSNCRILTIPGHSESHDRALHAASDKVIPGFDKDNR